MSKKDELKQNIWKIWEISMLAKKCLIYSYYFHKPETEEESNYLDKSKEFKFIRHILWRNSVIEFSKLFSNSARRDKYNIYKFLKNLNRDQYFGEFGIEKETIENWREKLKENEKTINSILLLRDKVYGHTDTENAINNIDTPTFKETRELLFIIESIIKEIYFKVTILFAIWYDIELPL